MVGLDVIAARVKHGIQLEKGFDVNPMALGKPYA